MPIKPPAIPGTLLCLVTSAWLAAGSIFAIASGAHAQTPDEHASHHPAGSATAAMPSSAAGDATPRPSGPAAGPAGGMGGMMEGMGQPAPKALYPTLMSLPETAPEKRGEISVQADGRMSAGTALLGTGLDALNTALPSDDYRAMQDALAQMRQGLALIESGVAAHRALTEGKPSRDIALQWFRGEMNLPAASDAVPHGDRGLSVFHLFTMALLIAFSFAMLAMYYFKMRRAAALFGRIEPDPGTPPPGSSPSLGGGSPRRPLGDLPRNTSNTPFANPPSRPAQADDASGPVSTVGPASATPVIEPSLPVTEKWVGRLTVDSITDETPSVKTFRLRAPDAGPLPFVFTPGQFLNVAFGIGGASMNRSYSISSSPNDRNFADLTIKREPRGAVSRHICDLVDVGDTIEVGGPVGRFTFDGTEADSVVLLSAGVGITPMTCIARYLTEQNWRGEIFFLYGCRTPADYILGNAISALERRNPRLHVAVTMSKPTADWKGPRGRITKEFLLRSVPGLATRRIHLCGPPTMMDETKAILVEIGTPSENVKTEAFGAVKPTVAAPGIAAKQMTSATGPEVTFATSGKSAKSRVAQTVLELSEELGIGIAFSCRVGTCGVCKVKLTAGTVDQAIDDALDANDKVNGIVLACQAVPTSQIAVEA